MSPALRAHKIRTAILSGEWWNATTPLQQAYDEADWLSIGGSWTGYLRQIPLSKPYACQLVRISRAQSDSGPHTTVTAAYRQARTTRKSGDCMEPGDGVTHADWEGCCQLDHVHRTRDIGELCECGHRIEGRPAEESPPPLKR